MTFLCQLQAFNTKMKLVPAYNKEFKTLVFTGCLINLGSHKNTNLVNNFGYILAKIRTGNP